MAGERPTRLEFAQAAIDELLREEIKQHAKNRQLDRSYNLEQKLRDTLTFHASVEAVLVKVFGGG